MLTYSYIEYPGIGGNLTISSTQGAALVDERYKETYAYDLITVKGIAAQLVNIYTNGDGYILNDPLRRNSYNLILDEFGYGFTKFCRYIDSKYTPLIVIAQDAKIGDGGVSTVATYDAYKRGPGRIYAVNYTAGGLNIRGAYCSIFLYIKNSIPGKREIINHVNINLISPDLNILEKNYFGAVDLESDCSVSISISSSSLGKKRLYVSLDESPDGEYVVIDLIFNKTL